MASTESVAELVVEVNGNIEKLREEMNAAVGVVSSSTTEIQARIDAMRQGMEAASNPISRMKSLLGPLAAGFGALMSIDAFAGLLQGAADAGEKLHDLASETGATVESLSALEAIGKYTDTTIDTIAGTMNKLSKNMATADEDAKGASAALKALGIDFQTFKELSPDQQMLSIAKAMDGFADGGGKTAAAMALMGKEGAAMIPMLKDLAAAGELNAVMTAEQATMADNYNDNMLKLSTTNEAWKKQISLSMLPIMDEISQALVEAASDATGLNGAVKNLSSDGTLSDWARVAVTGFTYLIDVGHGLMTLFPLMGKGIAGIAAMGATAFGSIFQAWTRMQNADLDGAWSALKDGMRDVNHIAGETATDISEIWNQELLGEKIRKSMAQVREARQKVSEEEAPKLQVKLSSADKDDGAEKATAYDSLVKAIKEKIAVQQLEASTLDKLTDGQKLEAKIKSELREGTLALTSAQKQHALSLVGSLVELEKFNDAMKKADQAQSERTKKILENFNEQTAGYFKAREALQDYSRSVDEANALADYEGTLIGQTNEKRAVALAQYRVEIELQNKIREIKKQNLLDVDKNSLIQDATAIANKQIAGIPKIAAADELTKFLDPAKAQTFGEALKEAFGEAGDSLAKLTNSLKTYGDQQAVIDRQRQNARLMYKEGSSELANAEMRINAISTQQQINSYAQMTGAAKSFFAEGSRGYKALNAAEQIYRAASLAMTLAGLAKQLFAVTTSTAATVAGETTKGAAITAGVGVQLAADTVKGASAAAVGIATQAQGDPYTAFARMAVMAAAMAALGFAVAGGGSNGGGKTAAEAQKEQGTGSVFGDASAKSDSISKSMETLKNNSNMMLPVNQGMLSALKNIESSMAGLTNLLIRTPGVTDGSNMGIQTGTIGRSSLSWTESILTSGIFAPITKLLGSLWGKTTQNIVDSGIQYGGSLNSLQQGQGFNQYASVDTTTSSWFGLKKSTSNSVQMQGLNSELSAQMGLIFTGLETTLKLASKGLGSSASDVEASLNNLVIASTTVSLKGLTGTALTEELNAVISKTMDEVAQAALPGLDTFRNVGEGYAQTVIRVSSGIEVAGLELEKLGLSAINFKQISNKQGDVGAEIVRQSIENVEVIRKYYDAGAIGATVYSSKLNGVGKIMSEMSGTATDLAKAYKELIDIRKQMTSVGMDGGDLNVSLIKGAGGAGELASGLNSYFSNYFTEAERAAAKTSELSKQFAALGVSMPEGRDGFRALIESTGTSTEAGAKLTGQLLTLSEAFNSVTEYSETLARESIEKAKATASKKTDLEIRLMELTGNATGALAARRQIEVDSTDQSLKSLQKRINAILTEQEATAAAAAKAKVHRDADIELMEALGNAEGALSARRADSLVGLDDYTQSIKKATWAALDATAAKKKEAEAVADQQRLADQARQAEEQASQQARQAAEQADQAAKQAYDSRLSDARAKLQAAVAAVENTLQAVISKLTSFTEDAKKRIAALTFGDLSVMSDRQKYERAKADLPGAIAKANAGDPESLEQLQQFVELSKTSSATFEDFAFDQAIVMNTLKDSYGKAESQLSVAKGQLEAIKAQTDDLLNIDNSVLSVEEAIRNLMDVTAGGLGMVADAVNGQNTAKTAAEAAKNAAVNTASSKYGFVGGANYGRDAVSSAYTAPSSGAAYNKYAEFMKLATSWATDNYDTSTGFAQSVTTDVANMLMQLSDSKGISAERALEGGKDYAKHAYARQYGGPIKAFASGGDFEGGLRLVGEHGPELEVTGPARIFNATQTASMLNSGGTNYAVFIAEMRLLRAEFVGLRAESRATAGHTAKMAKLMDRTTPAKDAVNVRILA